MKRRIYTGGYKVLAALLLVSGYAGAQCPGDSLSDASPFHGAQFRPQAPDTCAVCDPCTLSHYAAIPPDTGLVMVTLIPPAPAVYRVRIRYGGCTGQVYLDTCIQAVPPAQSYGWAADWSHGGWVVQVCGPGGGAQAFLSWKPSTLHNTSPLGMGAPPCGVLAYPVQQGGEGEEPHAGPWVIDAFTGRRVRYADARPGVLLYMPHSRRKVVKSE